MSAGPEAERASLWRRGGLSWRRLLARATRQMGSDEVMSHAAEIAFFSFFSIFPLLLFFTSLLGYVVEENAQLRAELFGYLRKVIPSSEALSLVRDTLDEVRQARGGAKLSLGLLISLWAASNGMAAVMGAVNKAFGLAPKRSWWLYRAWSLGLTLVFAVAMVIGLFLVFQGGSLGQALADQLGFEAVFLSAWALLQWVILLAVATASFDVVYNLTPGQEEYRFRWLTPGAVLAVLLWLGASYGLRLYFEQFAYTRIYGSLGAVIALLTWFFLTGMAILLGGEINSEIWKAEEGGVEEGAPEDGTGDRREVS